MKWVMAILVTLFIGCNNLLASNEEQYIVYVVNQDIHTDFLMPKNQLMDSVLKSLKIFGNYTYIEIGWGDAEYYMSDEFDLIIAAKALITLTGSVLRMESFKNKFEQIIPRYNFVIELKLSREQYLSFLNYINNSLAKNIKNQYVIPKTANNGDVRFFRSGLTYTIMHTCNSWTANAIRASGLEFPTCMMLMTEQIYREVLKFGVIVKPPDPNIW